MQNFVDCTFIIFLEQKNNIKYKECMWTDIYPEEVYMYPNITTIQARKEIAEAQGEKMLSP